MPFLPLKIKNIIAYVMQKVKDIYLFPEEREKTKKIY
jgi:hypothetical protein